LSYDKHLPRCIERHGYDVRILANQFNAKTAEIRQFLQGALDVDRTRELTDQDAGGRPAAVAAVPLQTVSRNAGRRR
jgi:hypothetical protein